MLKNEHGVIEIALRNDGETPKTMNIRQCIFASDQFTEPRSETQIDSAVIGMIKMTIIQGKMPSYKALSSLIPLSLKDYELYLIQDRKDVIQWHFDIRIAQLEKANFEVGVGECYHFTFFVKAHRTISSILNDRPEIESPYLKPSEFLKAHQLEVAVYQDELMQVRHILKELNESYVLTHVEEKESKIFRNMQRYIFRVHCHTTNFAMAFFWFGVKMQPVYEERRKKDNKHYKKGGKKIKKKRK